MDDDRVKSLTWFPKLAELVRRELEQLGEQNRDQRPALLDEIAKIDRKIAGWTQSLANAELDPKVRAAIEIEWAKAADRKQEIENSLAEQDARLEQLETILDPAEVLERLDRLAEVLAMNNPTLGNLELSLHVDSINCFSDGKVTMRTCKLGALTGAVSLLADNVGNQNGSTDDGKADVEGDGTQRATPRRRARLRVDEFDDGQGDINAAADLVADPNRFAGLGEDWFWEDTFQIPVKTWPFQEMAIEMATRRLAGQTHEELATAFGVTVPTVRKTLRYAAEVDERFKDLPRKMPRARRHEDHALEVAAKKAEGLGTNELVAFFKRNAPTTLKALRHAAELPGQSNSPEADV